MGYNQQNQYIIENDVDENDEAIFQKEMKNAAEINNGLPDGYEVEQRPINPTQSIQQEIQEAAEQEGLVSDTEYLGGEGASPQEVIDAMRNEGMSKGAQKNKEEYEEKKYEDFKIVTATRDLLLNRVQQTVSIYVPMIVEEVNPQTGKTEEIPIRLEFKARRLTEAENTHVLNHKLIGKEIKDMTDEEYRESSHFRSNLLSRAIVEPQMTAEEWRTQCDNATLSKVYDEYNKILTETDDVSRFQ